MATDPSVRARLQQAGMDLLSEIAGDDVDDPAIRRRRDERAAGRREREIRAEIESLKRESAEKDRMLREREALGQISSALRSSGAAAEHPFMFAGEEDPTAAVWEGLKLLQEGGLEIRSDADAEDAIAYVCKRLDDHHRSLAVRLGSVGKGGKPDGRHTSQGETTRGSRKDGADRREDRGGRTVTASGVGERAAPARREPAPQGHDDRTEDLFDQTLREELAERRRRAAQRPRR